jgi:hypothetical protein
MVSELFSSQGRGHKPLQGVARGESALEAWPTGGASSGHSSSGQDDQEGPAVEALSKSQLAAIARGVEAGGGQGQTSGAWRALSILCFRALGSIQPLLCGF